MNITNLKRLIKQYGFLYLTILVIMLGMKLFYQKADVTGLQWLLAPTAWWVQALSGISFEWIPPMGYVNHDLRFIIAKSCSGFQFMIITSAALLFSFLHRMLPIAADMRRRQLSGSKKSGPAARGLDGLGYILAGLILSYLLTILVNGLRIISSLYLPLLWEQSALFQKHGGYHGWLTPDSLHTLIGTAVYFASLLAIYRFFDTLTLKAFLHLRRTGKEPLEERENKEWKNSRGKALLPLLKPLLWYLFFVLGIPFLNRANTNGRKQLTSYAALVILACSAVLATLGILHLARHCRTSASRSTSRFP